MTRHAQACLCLGLGQGTSMQLLSGCAPSRICRLPYLEGGAHDQVRTSLALPVAEDQHAAALGHSAEDHARQARCLSHLEGGAHKGGELTLDEACAGLALLAAGAEHQHAAALGQRLGYERGKAVLVLAAGGLQLAHVLQRCACTLYAASCCLCCLLILRRQGMSATTTV